MVTAKQRRAINLQRKLLGRTTISGGGRSTLDAPTPGAGEITGTSQEREAQIQAFRRGGRSALIEERAKAERRIREEARAKEIEKSRKIFEERKRLLAESVRRRQTQARKRLQKKLRDSRKKAKENLEANILKLQKSRERLRKRTTKKSKKVSSITKESLDILTGGSLTLKNLDKKQIELNKNISNFNKLFGGRELTEKEFNQANKISLDLQKQQEELQDRREDLFGSKRFKFAESLRLIKEKPLAEKQIESKVEKLEKEKEILENKFSKSKSKFRKDLFEDLIRSKNKEISDTKEGIKPVVLTGDLPIIPANNIPSTISKVFFVGNQNVKGNKIITNLIFRTPKGQVGFVRGATVTKGKDSFTIVGGRSGKISVKFPSGKKKPRKITSFIGKEKVTVKDGVKVRDTLDLIKRKKSLGKIDIIKSNLRGLRQEGVGQISTVRGKKFVSPSIKFPSGKVIKKKKKGITLDDFASLSAVFTKKDLSLIIGNSITRAKDKASFIGLIKGESKAKTFFSKGSTQVTKKQLDKALSKVISAAASSVAKAERSGFKGSMKVAQASNIARASISPKTATIKKQEATIKNEIKKATETSKMQEVKIERLNKKLESTKISVKKTNRQISKTTSKQKKKLLQKQKSEQNLKKTQLQNQLQKQRAIQKRNLIQKQKLIRKSRVPLRAKVPRAKIPKVSLAKFPSSVKGKTKKPKPQQVFNVFGKSKGKFVKLNTKPLTRQDALDKGAFAVDRTTARTFKINPAGKTKTPGSLSKSERNYFNRQGFKLREVKIKRGRKFVLKNKFIEKSKHAIDTRSEKEGLTIAKLLKEQRKPKKKKKITPSQRKVLLKNLAKARKVRMKNLKGGRKK